MCAWVWACLPDGRLSASLLSQVTPRPGLLPFLELAAPFFDRLCIRTLSVNPRASAVIYCLDPQLQNLLKNALPKTGLPSWLQEWKAAQQRIRDCAESLFKLSGVGRRQWDVCVGGGGGGAVQAFGGFGGVLVIKGVFWRKTEGLSVEKWRIFLVRNGGGVCGGGNKWGFGAVAGGML